MSQKFASMDELFEALSHSAFRSKFRLSYADRTYAETRNDELLKKHAKEILHDRIGSAESEKRRQTDAVQGTSDLYCAARDRMLLPRLSL